MAPGCEENRSVISAGRLDGRRCHLAVSVRGLIAASALLVGMLLASPVHAATVPLSGAANGAPPVGHVWLIMLENHSWAENFGSPAQNFRAPAGSPASMTYLAKTLPSLGARLDN